MAFHRAIESVYMIIFKSNNYNHIYGIFTRSQTLYFATQAGDEDYESGAKFLINVEVPGMTQGDSKVEDSANCGSRNKSSLPLVFVNQVLLKHSCIHSFMHWPWLLLPFRVGWAQKRPCGPQNLNSLPSGPLQKKCAASWYR